MWIFHIKCVYLTIFGGGGATLCNLIPPRYRQFWYNILHKTKEEVLFEEGSAYSCSKFNVNMKRILTIVMIAIGLAAFADYADLPFGYHSVGFDTYGDGKTHVLDGECYALVWMASDCDFAGFESDGTLVDAEGNAVVYVRSLAEGGKCPPVDFIVKPEFTKSHPAGTYRVVVLDTRVTESSLAGLNDDCSLRRVNGWGWAKGALSRRDKVRRMLGVPASVGGALTDIASRLPADCGNLKITGFSFDEKGNAVVTVRGTKNFLSYRVTKGETPTSVGEEKGKNLVPGANDEDVEVQIVIPPEELDPTAGFFGAEAKTDWTK